MADMDFTVAEANPGLAPKPAVDPASKAPTALTDDLAHANDTGGVFANIAGTAQTVLSELHLPALESGVPHGLLDGAGGALGLLGAGSGAVEVAHGVNHGDVGEALQGGLDLEAGALGVGATIAGGALASTVAPAVGIVAGSYGLGRTLDTGVGNLMGEAGSTRTVQGRGVDAGTHEVRDDRPISERLADATHTATGDSLALRIAPYLPTWLGGG